MTVNENLLDLLGIKKNIPKVDFREYSGMFQAPSKLGKTTFASKLPKTVLLAFEQGYDAKVINYIDCTGDKGWEKLIEFLDRLEKNRMAIGNEIKILAIDTLEEMYASAETYMLKRESINDKVPYKNIGDIPYGNGYKLKDEYFKKQIKRIYALGLKPFYITHTKTKTIRPKDKNKEPFDIYIPTIPERCAMIIYPEVSYIIHGSFEVVDGKRTRKLQVQGSEDVEAGARVHINEDIYFNTEEEAIEKFEKSFKASIEKELRAAGIMDDIDTLAEQQDQEKLEAVAEMLEASEEDTASLSEMVDELKSDIKEAIGSGTIDKGQYAKALKSRELKSLDKATKEQLEEIRNELLA